MDRRQALERYWLLCFLFGLAFGIHYTLDVWVIQRLVGTDVQTRWAAKFLYVVVSFISMLTGEILGSAISDFGSRGRAILFSALALLFWGGVSGVGIRLESPWLFGAGAIAFGVGFGLFHSSLDAWIDSALEQADEAKRPDETNPSTTADPKVLASHLVIGAGLNYFGILLTSVAAYPLLVFTGDSVLDTDIKGLVPADLNFSPYLLALVAAVAIALLRPWRSGEPAHLTAPAGRPSPREGIFRSMVTAYWLVLSTGGWPFLIALYLGGCVSLVIQYIDHFAPADLILGDRVWDQMGNLFIYNLIICLFTALAGVFLDQQVRKRMTPYQRSILLGLGLGFVTLCLLTLLVQPLPLGKFGKALLVGVAQSVLLVLPPVIKSWTLEFAVDGLRATASSILGSIKRLFVIVATTILLFANRPHDADTPSTTASQEVFLYQILTGFVVSGLVVLFLPQMFRRRRGGQPPTGQGPGGGAP